MLTFFDSNNWTIIVMTAMFLPLLVKGSNGSFSNSFDAGDRYVASTIVTTTAQHQDNETIYLWIPLIVVLIFAVVITTLIVIGRQTHHPICKCLEVSSGLESEPNVAACPNLHLNVNVQINARDPTLPETPPPSYAVIARQISYISTISQTSSQIEVPPGYDEALDIADGTGELRTKRRGSQQLSTRGSTSTQAQLSKSNGVPRVRLFSRSSSATESPRRPSLLRQSSTPMTSEIDPEYLDVQVPQTSLNMTSLGVIHEAAGAADESQPNQSSENRNLPPFYIEETNSDDSA